MNEKIGFFGGTFDPIHNGHLHLAKEVLKIHKLDEIWFCPVRQNPLQLEKKAAPIEHRLKMIELAIQDNPQFKLIDIEAKKEGPSYTVDTLQQLVEEGEDKRQIYLIISDELISDICRWKDPQKIVELVPLIIGSRLREPKIPIGGDAKIVEAIKNGFTKTALLEISATDIRKRIKEGQSCENLVPEKALKYIAHHGLYKN